MVWFGFSIVYVFCDRIETSLNNIYSSFFFFFTFYAIGIFKDNKKMK
jgi:hypothetical protein